MNQEIQWKTQAEITGTASKAAVRPQIPMLSTILIKDNMSAFARLTLLTALLGLTFSAPATTIGLFNTGVDAAGSPLPNGTIGDPHYSLISVPAGGTTEIGVRTSVSGWPFPFWLGDDSFSTWIVPNKNVENASFTYRTTFDLTGLNPATAVITGQWATDDRGLSVLLNGADTLTPVWMRLDAFGGFTISSGFVSGLNTLDFVVLNGGGPTGLRVEMTGTAAPVPEPTTFLAGALLLLPLGAGTIRFSRKQRAA